MLHLELETTTNQQSKSIRNQTKSFNIQASTDSLLWENYNKITRPYVYVPEVSIVSETLNKYNIKMIVQNIGPLPAKDFIHNWHLYQEADTLKFIGPLKSILSAEYRTLEVMYPNEKYEYYYFEEYENKDVLKSRFENNKYLEIIIEYKGMDDKQYYYWSLMEIDNIDFTITKIAKWTRFN